MKRIFTLSVLALLLNVLGAGAQDKKTWDFTKGVSDETIANLTADKNWTVTNNDDGSFKQANEATKLSGKFMANDEPIKELEGLELGTAGLSKNNNVILMPNRFRINRDKMELVFPSLKNGQTITIVGRSANATAEDRGIKAAYDYMERIEGPEDNLIRASLGEVKNVWKIVTNDPNPVEVKFTMIKGGVDFTLFMIDEGDVAKVAKVAYVGDGTEDGISTLIKSEENTEVTAVNVVGDTPSAVNLRDFDVIVISGAVPATGAAADMLKEVIPFVPTLNLNADLVAAWGYGEVVMEEPIGSVKDAKHALFKGVDIQKDEDSGMQFVELGVGALPAIKTGEYFADDNLLLRNITQDGTVGDVAVVHLHNANHNAYLYLPRFSIVHNNYIRMLSNAISLLAASKADITAAATPAISQEFKDQKTIVSLAAGRLQPKTRFFYTTDGTTPTEESTAYTEPFTLTQVCTVKAVAIAEGYTLSDVATLDIDIHSQPKTPTMTAVEEDGMTTISVECETEDVQIWYNFEAEASADTTKSTKYVEPFTITMPQQVNVFAVAGQQVWSELGSQRVLVKNPRVVIDVAAHFKADQWTADNNPEGKAVANGKGMFSWGASATTMWVGEGTSEITIDPETGDEVEVVTHNPEDMREAEAVNEPGEAPEWVLKSHGTCLIWQNTTSMTTNFGQDSNYNPAASTDVDPLFPVTKNDIQFYKFQAGEPGNGSIETLNKYQAPLDVVVLANMQGGPLLVQVSADGKEWDTIGEIAKTGFARMWGKYTTSYDGNDEVFVRLTQEVASGGAKVFDIYIANQGEKSQALMQQLNEEYTTGIQTVGNTAVKTTGIYNINGVRRSVLQRGLNIVVEDGTVRKVMVK